jgi:peptidoglycan/LPS O-acetylase OafA/YrhL
MDSNTNPARVFGIDRIRAFAALSVMLAHTTGPYLPEIFRYVFTGLPAVFVFFVISGFCIHHPYVNSPLPVVAFYVSRLIRILPVALIAIALAKSSGHPDLAGFSLKGGYILWSVVCELWYYLLYPAFYFLSRYVSWRAQWLVSFLIYMIAVYLRPGDQWGNLHYAYGWYNLWIVGLPAWLTGCVLAHELPLFKRIVGSVSRRWLWRLLMAVAASLSCWLSWHSPLKYHYTMNVFALLTACWITVEIIAARDEVKSSVWDWFGAWSYSIYVFHDVARVYLQMAGMSHWTILILILMSCYLAFLIVEYPSHKIARLAFKRLRGRFQLWGLLRRVEA